MKSTSLHISGSGKPFIWLHGMLNSVESDSVYSLIDFVRLSKLVSVVRYNACNKASAADYSWNALTRELIEIANHQNYHSMILGGCSMGAGTAIHAAVHFPEKVLGLVLVTPPPAWEHRMGAQSVYKKVSAKTTPENIPEFLRRILELNEDPPDYFEAIRPGTRKRLLELRLAFEPSYYSSIYRGAEISDLPTREEIAQIQVPTLIVSNAADVKHPIKIAHELKQLIPNSELILISGLADYQNLQIKLAEFLGSITNNNNS